MEVLKNNKIINKILLSAIVLVVMIILNIKVYAFNVPNSTIYATSGDVDYWAVGNSSEWIIDNPNTSNANVVKVWKRDNRLYYEAKNAGTAKIYIRKITQPYQTVSRTIVVSKPTTSYLKVSTGTAESVQPLIVDFEKTWSISTKYGWSVSSPNVGIIKVTNIDHNNGKITFKALRSDISYISGNPGLTYIDIRENYTGVRKRFWIKVKPYVNSIKISNFRDPFAGDVQYLKATTYPEDYVGKAGYGKIAWTSSNPNIATVDSSGKVTFKTSGQVTINVAYSDGRHNSPYAWVNYTVGIPQSKLSVKYSNNNNNVKTTEEVFEGFGKTWKITSAKGWGISSPNNGIIDLKWDKNKNIVSYTGKKAGTTTITISEYYTGKSITYTVKVLKPVTKIEISNKPYNIGKDQKRTLTAKISPDYNLKSGGYGTIEWSTSDSNVAIISDKKNDEKGRTSATITVKDYGKATIKVTYKAGNNVKTDSLYIKNEMPKSEKIKRILNKAKEIKKYMAENGYEYCLCGDRSGCEHYKDNHKCGLTLNYNDSKIKGKEGYHNTCCATFVSWVLIEAGIIPESAGSNVADITNIVASNKFTIIDHNITAKTIKAGDIIIYDYPSEFVEDHVEIAAKDGAEGGYAFVYSAGSYKQIHNDIEDKEYPEALTSSCNIKYIYKILRIE